jgi:hypothetical protein
MLALLLATQLALADTPSAPAPANEPTAAPPPPTSQLPAAATAPEPAPTATATDDDAEATHGRMRTKFRKGQALGTTGALGVPVGLGTAYVALVSDVGWPLQTTSEVAIAGGVLGAAVSFPLTYVGTYTERSAIVGAGCTPRGQALRHAPLALLALGAGIGMGIPALGSPPENIEDVGVGVAAISWLTAAVQHVFLQQDSRDCGLRN